MPSKLTTAPEAEPVTIQEALVYLRIDVPQFMPDGTTPNPDSDAPFVTSLIPPCRRIVENYIGRALMPQTWTGYYDDFIERDRRFKTGMNVSGTNVPLPFHDSSRFSQQWPLIAHLELPKPPVQSVESVIYLDPTGTPQTLDPSIYLTDLVTEPCRIYLRPGKAWPPYLAARNTIAIECVCGYESIDLIPENAKLAIKMLVANFYENREPISLVSGTQPYEMPINIANVLADLDTEWC
jgi:uncharacterized phiE125 gp8 family phage protein